MHIVFYFVPTDVCIYVKFCGCVESCAVVFVVLCKQDTVVLSNRMYWSNLLGGMQLYK